MNFGVVESLRGIRFELPDTPRADLDALGGRKAQSRILVGGPAWSNKEWIGKVYPKGTASDEFLKTYATQLQSIELNASFYRSPTPWQVKKWREVVPDHFRFSPKVPRNISQSPFLGRGKDACKRFCDAMQEFNTCLGLSFLQLPPSFGPKRLELLAEFLASFPLALSIEFRNADWFSDGRLIPEAHALLKKSRTATVITDSPGRRDVVHTSLTADQVMIRFVGHNLHKTDYSRIEAWAEKFKRWQQAGMREIYFFPHHESYENVPELLYFSIETFNRVCGTQIPQIKIPQPSRMKARKK